MTGFIDTVIRVETKKLGSLIQALAEFIPYASIIGVNVAVPSYNPINDSEITEKQGRADEPQAKQNKETESFKKLTKVQKLCFEAIKAGGRTDEEIKGMSGLSETSNTKRAINNLRRKKYIKGHNGNYSII